MRRTELKRGDSRLERHVEIKRANAARRARAFEEDFGGIARVRFFQMQHCEACSAWPSVCAHVKSRGAGGKAADILPLCEACHRIQHAQGWSALPIADPAERARDWDRRWRERAGAA